MQTETLHAYLFYIVNWSIESQKSCSKENAKKKRKTKKKNELRAKSNNYIETATLTYLLAYSVVSIMII